MGGTKNGLKEQALPLNKLMILNPTQNGERETGFKRHGCVSGISTSLYFSFSLRMQKDLQGLWYNHSWCLKPFYNTLPSDLTVYVWPPSAMGNSTNRSFHLFTILWEISSIDSTERHVHIIFTGPGSTHSLGSYSTDPATLAHENIL